MASGNDIGRRTDDQHHGGGSPGDGLSGVSQGYQIALFTDKEGHFVQSINGTLLVLDPWVGVQLRAFQEDGRNWHRADITKYEPIDLMQYLMRKEK